MKKSSPYFKYVFIGLIVLIVGAIFFQAIQPDAIILP